MAETRVPGRILIVDYTCDLCGIGKLRVDPEEPQEIGVARHVCNSCNEVVILDKQMYPYNFPYQIVEEDS